MTKKIENAGQFLALKDKGITAFYNYDMRNIALTEVDRENAKKPSILTFTGLCIRIRSDMGIPR